MILLPLVAALMPSLATALVYTNSTDYADGSLGTPPLQSFQSSNITPPALNWNIPAASPPSYSHLLIAPRGTAIDTPGPLILNATTGEVVWDGTGYGFTQSMVFNVQTYQGKQVLALWQGAFNAGGWGDGWTLLLDEHLDVVANVSTTVPNNTNDFHEFEITTNDTALITVYQVLQQNLTTYNVSATDGSNGWIIQGTFQEIDIASGEALFTWNSLDHVQPSQCYASAGSTGVSEANAWDYFHINSIEKDTKGNYLISSRHCHAVYYISGTDGSILWQMGGMNSTFSMGDGTEFEWQHDAQWVGDSESQISLFDNAASTWTADETTARGLLLNVDTSAKTVTLAQQFLPYNTSVSQSQGSMQILPKGGALIGWGSVPYFSTYSSDGTLLSACQFGTSANSVQSYRAVPANLTLFPTSTTPNISVVANTSTSGYAVYASWNGATEVTQWQLLGAADTSSGTTILQNATRDGFETNMALDQGTAGAWAYLQVRGLMSNGSILGYSDFVAVQNGTRDAASSSESAEVTIGTAVASFTSKAATATASSSGTASATGSTSGAVRMGQGAWNGVAAILGAGVGMVLVL